MSWDRVATTVSKTAPVLGGLLGGPAGAAIGGVIATALGVEATPDRVHEALLAASPDALVRLREAEMAHLQRMGEMVLRADIGQLAEVNTTMRTEAAANDKYVSRWRPTFGYTMAATWAAVMLAIAWLAVTDPVRAVPVIGALADLSLMWSVGMSVVGVGVWTRSRDKALAAGAAPVGDLITLGKQIIGK
ncbi:MAG: holin family protein [Nitrospirota bacterium]|nr:holin family protein [Nitrospirota bacterium]